MNTEQAPPAYILRAPPSVQTPFLFTAPHSGRFYPRDMTDRTGLTDHTLRLSEDAYVDQLFEHVPDLGAPLLLATHARAYIDLNRAENELDASMFSPPLDPNTLDRSHRVQGGLGVIPRLVAEGADIYTQTLPAREAEKRLNAVYRPYHQKLQALMQQHKSRFNMLYLVDCHSMPSSGAGRNTKGSRNKVGGPDIILGDCWGKSCESSFMRLAEDLFLKEGFSVKRNVPYSGGYTTSTYGAPSSDVHTLQIEINRGLYMNETTHTPSSDFSNIKETLTRICKNLIEGTLSQKAPMVKMQQPRAAE